MKGLPYDFYKNNTIMQLLEYSIGDRNKFVFLDNSGEFHILNEGAGIWDEGVWYSNMSYKKYDNRITTNKTKFVPNKYWDDADDLCTCESCDEIVSIDEIQYDEYFDIMICQKCKESIIEYSLK